MVLSYYMLKYVLHTRVFRLNLMNIYEVSAEMVVK